MAREDRLCQVGLVLFILLFGGATFYWMSANLAPPRWDESEYLTASVQMSRGLETRGLSGFASAYVQALGYKAPLVSLVPLPWYAVVGHRNVAIAWSCVTLVVIFCLAYYALMTELARPSIALAALFITSTMPLTFGLARDFYTEYGLMTLVTLWLLLQWRSAHFRSSRYTLPLGVILGLGMLMKVSFPLYVAGPVAVGLLWPQPPGRAPSGLRARMATLLLIALAGTIVAGTWYAHNWYATLRNAFHSSVGKIAGFYTWGSPLAPATLIRYGHTVIEKGVSTYYAALAVVLLVVLAVRIMLHGSTQARSRDIEGATRARDLFLLSWFAVPFIVVSATVNKDYRFLLPAVPALAGLISVLLFHVCRPRWLRAVGIPLVLVFPTLVFVNATFDLPIKAHWSTGPWVWLSPEYPPYATRPIREEWPIRPILDKILVSVQGRRSLAPARSRPFEVSIVADHPFFNVSNFGYYGALADAPLSFTRPDSVPELLTSEYVVTKTGDQGPAWTTAYNAKLRQMLIRHELPFVELSGFSLPDGSHGVLFRRIGAGE